MNLTTIKDKLLAVWNTFSHEFHIAVIFFLIGLMTAYIIHLL